MPKKIHSRPLFVVLLVVVGRSSAFVSEPPSSIHSARRRVTHRVPLDDVHRAYSAGLMVPLRLPALLTLQEELERYHAFEERVVALLPHLRRAEPAAVAAPPAEAADPAPPLFPTTQVRLQDPPPPSPAADPAEDEFPRVPWAAYQPLYAEANKLAIGSEVVTVLESSVSRACNLLDDLRRMVIKRNTGLTLVEGFEQMLDSLERAQRVLRIRVQVSQGTMEDPLLQLKQDSERREAERGAAGAGPESPEGSAEAEAKAEAAVTGEKRPRAKEEEENGAPPSPMVKKTRRAQETEIVVEEDDPGAVPIHMFFFFFSLSRFNVSSFARFSSCGWIVSDASRTDAPKSQRFVFPSMRPSFDTALYIPIGVATDEGGEARFREGEEDFTDPLQIFCACQEYWSRMDPAALMVECTA